MVLFNIPRDKNQISGVEWLSDDATGAKVDRCYNEAIAEPYGYLFIDLHTKKSGLIKLRSNILPLDPPMYAYIDKQLYGKTFP